jgi:hypothetical protein
VRELRSAGVLVPECIGYEFTILNSPFIIQA